MPGSGTAAGQLLFRQRGEAAPNMTLGMAGM